MERKENEWIEQKEEFFVYPARNKMTFLVHVFRHITASSWFCEVRYEDPHNRIKKFETESFFVMEDAKYAAALGIRERFPKVDLVQEDNQPKKDLISIPDVSC